MAVACCCKHLQTYNNNKTSHFKWHQYELEKKAHQASKGKKSQPDIKRPHIHKALTYSAEKTLEEMERKLKPALLPVEGFRRHTQFHTHLASNDYISIFFCLIKSIFFFFCLNTQMALLLFLVAALPHVSPDYINIDSDTLLFWRWTPAATICQELSGGTRRHVCARLSSPLRLLGHKQRQHGAMGLRRGVCTAWSSHWSALKGDILLK